jgi:hypothetical protein
MAHSTPMPTDDPLEALRERIRATQEAAERLAAEQDGPGGPGDEQTAREAQALVALLQTLRDVVPPELWQQIRDLMRQLLLLIRAIIDWWVDRIEQPAPRGAAPVVEDIEIS